MSALALAAVLLLPAPRDAEPIDAGYLVEVQPGPRRYFYADARNKPDCPAMTAACRRRAYVIAGDLLIGTEVRGELTHAIYSAGGGRPTEGWIETAALRRLSQPTPTLDAWLGDWYIRDEGWEASLTLKRSATPGMLHIEGESLEGTDDPERVEKGGVHVGLFVAETGVQGDRLGFSDAELDEPGAVPAVSEEGFSEGTLPYDAPGGDAENGGLDRCRIRMRLLGPYLLVTDNDACRAARVSVYAVYRH